MRMTDKIIPPFGGFVVYSDERGNIFERMFGHERAAPIEEPSSDSYRSGVTPKPAASHVRM